MISSSSQVFDPDNKESQDALLGAILRQVVEQGILRADLESRAESHGNGRGGYVTGPETLTITFAPRRKPVPVDKSDVTKARELDSLVPRIGSVYDWEPLKPSAADRLTVTATRWNGEEWQVESQDSRGRRYWNDMDRWVEATVLYEVADDSDDDGEESYE